MRVQTARDPFFGTRDSFSPFLFSARSFGQLPTVRSGFRVAVDLSYIENRGDAIDSRTLRAACQRFLLADSSFPSFHNMADFTALAVPAASAKRIPQPVANRTTENHTHRRWLDLYMLGAKPG